MYIILIIIAIALVLYLLWHHQHTLKVRAYLMTESIRNRDFSFRLSTKGLLFGERAMQQSLNDMGEEVRQLVNHSEVESWEKLTRVLTHEIMNSTAPIASISSSLLNRDDVVGTPLEEGIRAIHSTAARLNTFVVNYRKMSQLQKPEPQDFDLTPFLKNLTSLYPELEWEIDMPSTCTAHTDAALLHQVLINMVKNALEAGAKKMGLKVERIDTSYHHQSYQIETSNANRVSITISNDGKPIPPDVRSSIFIPFFTTKATGSGIGLSLSRQIIIKQGGSLELLDTPMPTYHTSFCIQI
ncbi:MAG: HAMP domain-containing histidine kinase [Bacteroidaceae bacterium]|jgi:signal transduction histidine kinase|nr:HAMP domain-containing histidine kinase [Bacteroidaceae bacterium]